MIPLLPRWFCWVIDFLEGLRHLRDVHLIGARLAGPFDVFIDPGPFPTTQVIDGRQLPARRCVASPATTRWVRHALVSLGAEKVDELEMVTTTWDGVGTEPNVSIIRRDADAALLAELPGVSPVPAELYAQMVFQASIRKVLAGFMGQTNVATTRARMQQHLAVFVRPRIAVLESFVGRPLPLATWSLDYDPITMNLGVTVILEPKGKKHEAPAEEIPTGGNPSEPDLVEQVRVAEGDGDGEAIADLTIRAHAIGDAVLATARRIGTKEILEAVDFLDPNGNRHDEDGTPRGYEVPALLERVVELVSGDVPAVPQRSEEVFYVVIGNVGGVSGYVGSPRGELTLAVWLEPTHPAVKHFESEAEASSWAGTHGDLIRGWVVDRITVTKETV